MPEIVQLPAPNVDALKLIEDIATRLREGESVAVAIVEVRKGRVVATAWSEPPEGAYHLLNSGAARLAHRLAGVSD